MSRETQRRAVVLTTGLLIAVNVALFVAVFGRSMFPDGSSEVDVAGVQMNRDEPSQPSLGSSTTRPASGAGSSASSPPVPVLPRADTALPPAEPVGVYKQGKVTLRGSVPSDGVGAAYVRRLGSVIGESNVIQEMRVDPRVTQRAIRVDVDEQFRFPAGSVAFDPKFAGLVDLGSVALKAFPETTLVVTGHSDVSGDPLANLTLSRQRAQVIVDHMTSRGIPTERLVAVGAGSSVPVADNTTAAGREANRRIEASLDGFRPD